MPGLPPLQICMPECKFCIYAGYPQPHGDRLRSLARPVHTHKRHLQKEKLEMAKTTPDRTTVSGAINVLPKAGYRATDISVLIV
jgi:hypothetical protein